MSSDDELENSLHTSFRLIRQEINKIEEQSQRAANSVTLLAVSKTRSAEEIATLAALGQNDFGENYIDEALDKINQLQSLNLTWHCIGPLQSNKTKHVAQHFAWFHALDRLKIAQRLNDQRPDHLPPLNICIQLNLDDQSSKSGVGQSELTELCEHVADLPRLKLRGLMAIPAPRQDFSQQQQIFQHLQLIYSQYQTRYGLDTLSMGMSQDMHAAISAGSTMVRIGTALFGSRPEKERNNESS